MVELDPTAIYLSQISILQIEQSEIYYIIIYFTSYNPYNFKGLLKILSKS